MKPRLSRTSIDRLNEYYQRDRKRSPAEVYELLDQDIIDIIRRFGISYSDLHSKSRDKGCTDARAHIAVVALERLSPLGISEGDVAAYIQMKRTTMLAGRDRWIRDHGQIAERKG